MNPVLSARDIEKVYQSDNSVVRALDGVSLEVRREEFLCIIGPSGCGKTTLLRILAGLLRPTRGAVYLEGKPLTAPSRRIGFVFQKANLMPWRTVLANVTLPLEIQGIKGQEAERKARELLSLVGLEGFEGAYPHQLSGGMQQRVAIARALVHEPCILLLDEPFGPLDALTRERLNLELLRIWRARRKTVVMVTHDMREAIFLADRVLVLSPRPGRIVAEVPITLPRPRQPEMLYTESFGTLYHQVHQFISEGFNGAPGRAL